jgi:hypothetical protein
MSLLDKSVVLLPPYATKSIYTVVKEFEHKGRAKVRLRHPKTGSEHAKLVSEIRIASDQEQACGHRIDPHKAFEEWFKKQPFYGKLVYMCGDRIFDFDYADQTYRTLTVNVSWITWQYKNPDAKEFSHLRSLDEMTINHLGHANQEWQLKCHKLQKQVDAINQLIEDYKDPSITSDKSFQHGLLLVVRELEQALKGGAE